MEQRPVPATMPLAVTLEAQQWNQVLTVLLDTPHLPLPHRAVAPLIQTITDQIQQAATRPPGNGLDREDALLPSVADA
jgi:hypothetical protein